jgi:hypothetical protein
MKNLLFHLKAVKTGTLKAQVGAGASSGAGNFLKVGAGVEKNSFGSTTLVFPIGFIPPSQTSFPPVLWILNDIQKFVP